jgi:predicted metal-dependent phosphoesterase TrpH
LSTGAPSFDLQSHSTYSDGELAPAAVVAAAADAGVELLALTDHDSVEGVEAAAEAAAATASLELVTGVEISALDPISQDIHILGYRIDTGDSALRDALERSRADRELRSVRMGEALRELGFELDEELLHARAAAGKTIGRPHLAQAAFEHPANAERLRAEGLDDASAFLVAYLIEGRPAFRGRRAPAAAEAIELIHGAGGVAVWAHPFWDVAEPADVLSTLDRFVAAGLDGVEAFYATHTCEQTELLVDRCEELSLLTTGSSDFHGPNHRIFDRFRAFDTCGRSPNLGVIVAGEPNRT